MVSRDRGTRDELPVTDYNNKNNNNKSKHMPYLNANDDLDINL